MKDMVIKSLYWVTASDEANGSWDREACNSLKYVGNNVFTDICDNVQIEYRFNANFTECAVATYVPGSMENWNVGVRKPVQVTFEEGSIKRSTKEEKESVWKISPMHALCALETDNHVNYVGVDEDDFVNKFDHAPDNAPEYGCGNMKADVLSKIPEGVLDKYHITEGEWHIIAYEISKAVSFGCCGWCA